MVSSAIAAALATGTVVGVLGLAWTFLPERSLDKGKRRSGPSPRNEQPAFDEHGLPTRIREVAVPTAIGLLCVIITRWPIAGILGTLAAATLPNHLRKVVPGASSKRAEAVASWTELIRDSMAASAGLAQAIVVTASSAPISIRPQVSALAMRLTNGMPLDSALRCFAGEVGEPAAEFLVCALLMAATSRAQRLVDVLGALAEAIREDVAMRLRIDASRASARSSMRTVVLFSLGFAFALTVVAHSYLSPFGTAEGQLVLGAVGLLYAIGLTLMVRLVRPVPQARLLDAERIR